MSKVAHHLHQTRPILERPHVTEKAAAMSTNKAPSYTFRVSSVATKPQIAAAIFAMYKVKPKKITVATMPAKKIVVKGKKGTRTGFKKAVIFLAAGDTINIV